MIHDEVDAELQVCGIEEVADGVRRIRLTRPDGLELPRWTPGAHIDLVTPVGRRQYSLCGDASDRYVWQVGVLREQDGRGGSAWAHDVLAVGDVVAVRGPRNNFELEPATEYLFIAGGIGITPLLPMVAAAHRDGVPWRLVHGGRSRTSMAFSAELVTAHGDRIDLWPQDERGIIDLASLLADASPEAAIYCCGPEPLLRAVEESTSGRPDGSLHLERFAPKAQGTPVRSTPFEVELASTGDVLVVPPEVTVLAALEGAGVPVVSSCLEGTCGTCETVVLRGEVDHRDSLLTDAERAANDVMFVCCSRSVSDRLVLDV